MTDEPGTWRIGIVQQSRGQVAVIRDLQDWRRRSALYVDIETADVLMPGTVVSYAGGRSGWAKAVRIVSPPAATITRACVECDASFSIEATTQAWYAMKQLESPRRCPKCRQWRRAAGVHHENNP